MWPALEAKVKRFRELEAQLSDPVVASDHARFSAVAKEHGSLARLVKPYLEFQQLDAQIKQSEELLATETDPDMKAMAEEELAGLRPRAFA